MSNGIAKNLRSELTHLSRSILLRAASAPFGRIPDNRGRDLTLLRPSPQQTAAAAIDHRRLLKWAGAIESVLRRRGKAMTANALVAVVADLKRYVCLTLEDGPDLHETEWRAAFVRKFSAGIATLDGILAEAESDLESLGRRQPVVFDSFGIVIEPVTMDLLMVKAATHVSVASIPSRRQPAPDQLTTLEAAVKFGRVLYRTLMVDSVRKAYVSARAAAHRAGHALSLQLDLRRAPDLGALPWEVLHDGERFLALSRSISICRRLAAVADAPPAGRARPLRILVTISSPRSLPWIDNAKERQQIEDALAPVMMLGNVSLEIAEDGSLDTLYRLYRAAAERGEPYDVWHFIGHGDSDEQTGRSTLVLTRGPDNEPHYADGFELGPLFHDYPPPRLVVLNGCKTACEFHRVASGVAAAIAGAGVPAIIAMQFVISDVAARTFSQELYGALIDGAGLPDAVTDARKALFCQQIPEWFTPVFFGVDGSLHLPESRSEQK